MQQDVVALSTWAQLDHGQLGMSMPRPSQLQLQNPRSSLLLSLLLPRHP